MVAGEKQSFPLRISILYCFECYLYKNDSGKSVIIQTLLPQTENGQFNASIPGHTSLFLSRCVSAAHQYTLGHLLITGFLSKETVASWCSNIALAHLLADHQQYKEALLQVVLAVDQAQAKAKTLMEMSVDLLENVPGE